MEGQEGQLKEESEWKVIKTDAVLPVTATVTSYKNICYFYARVHLEQRQKQNLFKDENNI